MAKILVLRFSAIGDVAMTIPVVCSFAAQYPEHELLILSAKRLAPLFENLAPNVFFYGVELHSRHRKISGIFKLFRELSEYKIDYVADLHGVLRSQLLSCLFWSRGIKVAHIHKERFSKHQLTRRHNKKLYLLKTTTIRYVEVFNRLGFSFFLHFDGINISEERKKAVCADFIVQGRKNIGIAPFAHHKGKIYPIEQQEVVVASLSKRNDISIFLFGGGKHEEYVFSQWADKYPNVVSVAGRFDLLSELALIGSMDLMLTMDSANMHLASLVNTPVISIWGATHPYCGFLGWKQTDKQTIQTDLHCRPCSVYGQRPCYRKDYACMYQIAPQQVVDTIIKFLFHTEAACVNRQDFKSYHISKHYKLTCSKDLSALEKNFVEQLPQYFMSEGKLLQNVRNTLKIFQVGGRSFVVKKYKRPFFLNRFIYGIWRKSKASRAYEYSLKLLSRGIQTPNPIAYLESKHYGFFDESYFVNELSSCRFLYNHLAIYPEKFPQKEAIMKQIGIFTARIHESGFLHLDYSGGNILFDICNNDIRVEVIDLNRMSFKKIDMYEGCKNFERLLGDELMFNIMIEAYAVERKFSPEKCIRLASEYRRKHMKKNQIKYLLAIQTASYFLPLTEKFDE